MRTGQNTVARLYGLFGDIENAYGVTFDWRRFRPGVYRAGRRIDARVHSFRVPTKAPLALPDAQFGRLLERAGELWGDTIAGGDQAYAADPESQQGALFARNVAILLVLWYAGARRAEVPPIDLGDIDRSEGYLNLVTKGRHGGKEPVVLLPAPDFFPAWEREVDARRRRVERLSAPGSDLVTVAASEAAQLAEVERIFAELRTRAQA